MFVEPLERNITAEDWFEIWCQITEGLGLVVEPGPIRERLMRHEIVNLDTWVDLETPYYDFCRSHYGIRPAVTSYGQLYELINDVVVVETKFGNLECVWWNIDNSITFYFNCGGVTYEIIKKIHDFETLFPDYIVNARRSTCGCEDTISIFGGECLGSGSPHRKDLCPYCFKDKTPKKFAIIDWWRGLFA